MSRLLTFLTLSSLLFTLSLAAQTPDTATIHGQVVDQSHAVVSGVQITVSNTLTGLERKVQTDSSGKFSLEGLPIAGSYPASPRANKGLPTRILKTCRSKAAPRQT